MSGLSKDNDWVNPLPGVPDIESPFFDDIFSRKTGAPGYYETARHLREHGYAVIDLPVDGFEALAESIKQDLAPRFDFADWRARGREAGESLRIQDAWRELDAVRTIAGDPAILDLLGYLFGRRAFPFQTLNFPVGTQQHFHTDAVHFSSVPERFMCGVWVALEDIDADNGPLVYYPGSHRLPVYVNEHIGHFADDPKTTGQAQYEAMWRELMRASGLEPQRFFARKGQALIWLSNLFHGGDRHLNPDRTRWSQVTHYYFEDCTYYTPLHSDPIYGRMLIRDIEDAQSGKPAPNRYLGRALPDDHVERLKRGRPVYMAPPEDFDPETYLALNPDVKAAKVDPVQHFISFGQHEGRRYKP